MVNPLLTFHGCICVFRCGFYTCTVRSLTDRTGSRELLWLIGMAIFAVLMMEGFFGYLLPWGNMSYWGAQVIVS